MASKNEKAAAKLGMTLKQYKSSAAYKKKKAEKNAEDKVEKFYDEKKKQIKDKAKTETSRLQEDMKRIMEESGIQQNRATEDYLRNIGNIEANKSADLADLNDYVKTNTERTQEDLGTALSKEARRFGLESDKINQELANAGMTFSDRKSEKIAQEGNAMNVADIQTEANRSFQDIARYEATLNRDIEMKYGQQEEAANITKTRSIEDILRSQKDRALANQRGQQDIAFGKSVDIKDLSYAEDTDLATLGQLFDTATSNNNMWNALNK